MGSREWYGGEQIKRGDSGISQEPRVPGEVVLFGPHILLLGPHFWHLHHVPA